MRRFATFAAIVFCVVATRAQAADLKAEFNDAGLSSLKWKSTELLMPGPIVLQHLNFQNKTGPTQWEPVERKFDPASKRLTQNYVWGSVTCDFAIDGDKLSLHAEVKNSTAANSIHALVMDLIRIELPQTPKGVAWKEKWPQIMDNPENLPVVVGNWGDDTMIVCGDVDKIPPGVGIQPRGSSYAISINFDGPRIADKPIPPGASRKFNVSLRFGGKGATIDKLAGDALKKFAAKNPFELKWDDRRPIGTAFLATSEPQCHSATNPRGWFQDPKIDTTTDAGREEFKSKMFKYADDSIRACKDLDAQGVIMWDVEGQEFPHTTSYIGDPRLLKELAPEFDAFADEFFKKFTDAGLKTGLTIRPTHLVKTDGAWKQTTIKDEGDELEAKIVYAKKRWGCTLFYVDSNLNQAKNALGQAFEQTISPEVFRAIGKRHPDILLIPEHENSRYWAWTAPYNEYRLGWASTPADVRATYPAAFSVLRMVDGDPLENRWAELVAAVKAGDILLFRTWWPDPVNEQVKKIYQEAREAKQAAAMNQ